MIEPINRIIHVVSSHVSMWEATAPHILNSLIAGGVAHADILVVVGGAPDRTTKKYRMGARGSGANVEVQYVTHNSYDHTGLIEIAARETWKKKHERSHVMALHDTCAVGPKYASLLEKRVKELGDAQYYCVHTSGFFNMGLFSPSGLETITPYLPKLKNCGKMRAMLSERLYTRMLDTKYLCHASNRWRDVDYYGEPLVRISFHFPEIDLYKFQSQHAASAQWIAAQNALKAAPFPLEAQ